MLQKQTRQEWDKGELFNTKIWKYTHELAAELTTPNRSERQNHPVLMNIVVVYFFNIIIYFSLLLYPPGISFS